MKKKKYIVAVHKKDTHEVEIFEFKSIDDRASFIEEIKVFPEITYSISEI